MTEGTSKQIKFYCNSCLRETNHDFVGEHERRKTTFIQTDPYGERSESIWSIDRFQMLRCLGCDTITYRHENYFSEDQNLEFSELTGNLELLPSYVDIFPPRQDRSAPYWIEGFSKSKEEHQREIAHLFQEIYAARGQKANRLAAIGTRTALDILLTNQIGDDGTFAERVKLLSAKLGLSQVLADAAMSVVGIGNAAAHRGSQPSDQELSDLLDLVEEILKAVYVTPAEQEELQKLLKLKAEKIKSATPARIRNAVSGIEPPVIIAREKETPPS